MDVAIVSSHDRAAAACVSAESVLTIFTAARVHVLDVDGSYPTRGDGPTVTLLRPADVGIPADDVHRDLVTRPPHAVRAQLRPRLAAHVLAQRPPGDAGPLLDLLPGVLVVGNPLGLVEAAEQAGAATVAMAAVPDDGLWPGRADLDDPDGPPLVVWIRGDVTPEPTHDPGVLSAASLRRDQVIGRSPDGDGLTVDGVPVTVIDLHRLDGRRPWLLDGRATHEPRGRLSDHPVLATFVDGIAERLRAVGAGPAGETVTSLGQPIDPALRVAYATAQDAPDPFDPADADRLRAWLIDAGDDGLPRYLSAVRRSRPDLVTAFPDVPGADTAPFAAWALRHAAREGFSSELVGDSLRRAGLPTQIVPTRRRRRPARKPDAAPGVTVVGFLGGDLGIGESARLMVQALRAANVPHSSLTVTPPTTATSATVLGAPADLPQHEVALVCVNADVTPAVVDAAAPLLGGAYRIGMWYWEAEDFPTAQHGAFDYVDEVWVATDFVARAIEPHSPVPVTTVLPPLPQRTADPVLRREDLGLPAGPLFLFTFDYLSTAERKNPWGVVAAFRRAFAPGEGPTLVVKSVNADQRPAEAERLRLAATGRSDIVLLEHRFTPQERDALVALCDCYVSLHRSEGLGLTMAEAMAWGKPVIATNYGGNIAFMTAANSYLIPWEPAAIPDHAEPYPVGGMWAEPDLAAAAAAMRQVLDDPADAAARGARAAHDIATSHSAEAAGARVAARLATVRHERSRVMVVAGAGLRAAYRRAERAVRARRG